MKILIDGRLYGLENAGLGRYLINLVAELSKIDSKNDYVILLRKKYFDTLMLSRNWKKILADFRHYSFAEQLYIPGIIKKENPDLVHFPHFNVPVFYRGNYVVTIHDMLMHDFAGVSATTLPGPVYNVKQIAYKFDFGRAVSASLKIIVPSNSVKEELTKYYKVSDAKVETIYEGVDVNIAHGISEKFHYPYFVYAGNAYPHKNLERLVEAIVMLNENTDKKVLLVIASARNIFTKRLEKIIKKLKAEEFVKLLGFVPDAELGSLYKNSLGFSFPSLSEGFGLPGLEALNSGTLLLASEIPVFKEIYGKNATYFNAFDFSSIEKAMERIIEMDPNSRRGRILEGQAYSKRYSWTKMAKETLKIYESSISLRQGK